MIVTVFGAAGPTGKWACREALAAGHEVRAVSRRTDPIELPAGNWTQVRADAQSGDGVATAVAGVDAVLSVLGSSYQRAPIDVYSVGTRTIVDAMRAGARGRRLVVVSSGLTYPPPHVNWFADHVMFPLLRDVVGKTLYADMRRMEEFLRSCDDIEWTIMRPGRLYDAPAVSDYRVDLDDPQGGFTSRADLGAAMVAELAEGAHPRAAVAPTTAREGFLRSLPTRGMKRG